MRSLPSEHAQALPRARLRTHHTSRPALPHLLPILRPRQQTCTGTWKEKDPNEDSYQIARVTADAIEIYWHTPDSDALYWAGSYVAPTDSKTPYTWDSVNNTEKTGSAILASSAETKTFTYTNNTISYSVTALGVTKKVTMERADIDVPNETSIK